MKKKQKKQINRRGRKPRRFKRKRLTVESLRVPAEAIKETIAKTLGNEMPKNGREVTLHERTMGEVSILQVEWAVFYPTASVRDYLVNFKGYSENQYIYFMQVCPAEEWEKKREAFQNRVTENIVKRNIDVITEIQERHVRSANIGLAKAIEMLSKFQIDPMRHKNGKAVLDPLTKKPMYNGFRSIDLLNCMNAIEKAQIIYRRAMGLPNDGEGLAQIIQRIKPGPTTQNVQININPKTKAEGELVEKVESLTYDEIMTFIERKRERMKEEKEQKKLPSPSSPETSPPST